MDRGNGRATGHLEQWPIEDGRNHEWTSAWRTFRPSAAMLTNERHGNTGTTSRTATGRQRLGVAVQGNWVMGPGDYQPLAVVGTSRPAGRSKEHKMRKLITAMAIGGALAAGGIVVAGPASADGLCGGAVVLGNGGGRCDYDQRPDGSFTRCDTVFVLGFGGTNCYRVSPPPPADAPPAA